jgi:hypothetical protein
MSVFSCNFQYTFVQPFGDRRVGRNLAIYRILVALLPHTFIQRLSNHGKATNSPANPLSGYPKSLL